MVRGEPRASDLLDNLRAAAGVALMTLHRTTSQQRAEHRRANRSHGAYRTGGGCGALSRRFSD